MIITYSTRGDRTFKLSYDHERYVPPTEIRTVFNDNAYYPKALAGQIEQHFAYMDRTSEFSNQLEGTTSEIIVYHLGEDFIAEVHCFVLPDSVDAYDPALGASGLPDPKELIHTDGVYYRANPTRRPRPRTRVKRDW